MDANKNKAPPVLYWSLRLDYGDVPSGFVFESSAKDWVLGLLNPESFPQLGAHFGQQLETTRL